MSKYVWVKLSTITNRDTFMTNGVRYNNGEEFYEPKPYSVTDMANDYHFEDPDDHTIVVTHVRTSATWLEKYNSQHNKLGLESELKKLSELIKDNQEATQTLNTIKDMLAFLI